MAAAPLFEKPETPPTAQLNSSLPGRDVRRGRGRGQGRRPTLFRNGVSASNIPRPPRAAPTLCATLLRYSAKSKRLQEVFQHSQGTNTTRGSKSRPQLLAPRSGTGRVTAQTPGPNRPTRAGAERNRRHSVSSAVLPLSGLQKGSAGICALNT